MSTTFTRGENPLRADKLNTALSERVSRGGDTMQGRLTLAGDPVAAFDAATKQYVDRFTSMGVPTGAYIGAAPPGNVLGPLWWDSVSGQLFIQYNDGSSTQWVSANSIDASTLEGSFLPITGGTMQGPLNYTATGGNTLRSVQDRSAQVVNVKDYGAKGDGVTDDSATINAAMVSAASSGKACYMPAGVYRTGGLTYPAGLSALFGDGRDLTIIRRIDNATVGTYMFSPTNIRGFTVHDLTIDGNAANNTQISAGIVATGCWRFRFYNAAIINTTSVSSVYGWGVYLTAGKDGEHGTSSSIHDCDFTSVPGGGVVVMDTTKNVSVRRCSFHQCANGAIAIGGGGLNPGDCTGCEVSNCTVVGPGGGIGIGTYRHPGFMVDSCQYCNIIDNVVSETGYYGIAIQSQYCNVTGNTVLHCSLLFAGGAGVLFNADHSNFTGNTIANCQGGIDAGGAQNSLISGNNIGDSWGTAGVGSGYGMNLGASNNNIIANNVFNNNAGRSGNDYGAELGIHPYDGGGDMPAFPFVGANNQVIGNTFNLVSSHAWGISCSDLPNGVVITDNVFNGGAESFLISAPCQSVVIKNNVWTGAMRGTSVAAAPMVVFPDYADTILLTGAQASISQIMTNGQQANYGRFTHAAITNGGNYSTPPTLTITGTGTGSGAAANAMLNGPAPTAVGGIAITNMGVGVYTSLTITPSSGALTTVAYVGAGNATVGREITIVNTSGNNQILVNNTFLQLSGGANLILAPNASIRLRGTGSDASGYPVFTEMSARPAINLAAPGAIGGTTPAPGTFTDVTANNAFTVYGVSRFPNANVSIGSGSANPGLTVNGGGSGANDGPMLILQWNGVTRGGLGGYSAFSGGGYDPRTMLAGYDGLLFSTQNVIAGGIDTSFNLYANGAVRCGGATGPSWTTGSAVPSSVQPVGSLYSRVSTWSAGATLYVSKGAGAWTAVASV